MTKIAEKEIPRRNSAVHTNQTFKEMDLRCSRQKSKVCVTGAATCEWGHKGYPAQLKQTAGLVTAGSAFRSWAIASFKVQDEVLQSSPTAAKADEHTGINYYKPQIVMVENHI